MWIRKDDSIKKLENLKWSSKWVTHLGWVKGCLDYLGVEISNAWLYGGSGHAFILNISKDSCPSGPTAWKTMMLFQQAPFLGYQIEGIFGSKYHQNLDELQREAWQFTLKTIDEGFPVYAWEIEIPEFYVVNGYDETGYYYSGPGADEGKGPKPWNELGDTGIGLVELYSVRPVEAQPPDMVVKPSFEKVLKHAENPGDWIFENYDSGLRGYDLWIEGLKTGVTNRFGMGYNIVIWLECRNYAVEFLEEARNRVGGETAKQFDATENLYRVVVEQLEKLTERYPWFPGGGSETIPVDKSSQEAVGWLNEARKAEAEGLKIIHEIKEAL